MKMIALSGKMHSGKSYVADRLVAEHGYKRLSFAEALKDDVKQMGFFQSDIDEKPPWMRALLQAYGQARRAVDPDYWVTRMRMKIHGSYHYEQESLFSYEEEKIVIDDLRFENEADMLVTMGEEYQGMAVKLVRLERVDYDRSGIPGADDASETALDDYPEFDHTLYIMSGDLPALRAAADWMVEDMEASSRG